MGARRVGSIGPKEAISSQLQKSDCLSGQLCVNHLSGRSREGKPAQAICVNLRFGGGICASLLGHFV